MKSHRGFISFHLCLILASTLLITTSLYEAAVNYHSFRDELESLRQLNWLEVVAINRAKQRLRNYDEEDEILEVGDGTIELRYDGLTVTIIVYYQDHVRERILEFDDINDVVTEYY
ncbi:MAG: hypothetical protein IJJ19_07340 [Erysipelotrichaceae bacterium]|nr:hypothetical protein [Erysipelotrichaceae bacterium]MBR0474802.1 hypothetical protein [Erysipelotrichaceae bacterium]